MDHATGAMGSLLLKLGQLLKEEYKLQTGVKEDVQYLERELKNMEAALRKVRDVPRDQLDEQVKLWAHEVRELSYRMEDAIDKFLVRVEGLEPTVKPHKLKQLMKKMGDFLTNGKTRREISSEVKDIKVRVQEAAARRDSYRVGEVVANPASATTVDPRLLDLYKDRKELVGTDEALSKLTNMLTQGDGDGSKQLKIFSIFGFGGLGKTTLAKAVYDKLQAQFAYTAFVTVGRKPSTMELLNDILLEIDKQKYPGLNERQLINKLRELLENKRYFIVIDDIWDIETWKMVRCALVNNNCASRIITTTRILEVAEMTGDEVYRIKPLSLDLSEELFNRRLFGGKNKCPQGQSAMVKSFLHKCGGVPLAIITIASVLVGKPMEVEAWSKVYNSIGFGDEHNKDVENTRKILLFSYYDLPCHLRTCLLYLSQYREDSLIMKDSLISRWVAEGFVLEEQGVGLFEIGERYFNALVNKSLLQPVEIPNDGIIHCRLHDIVLDMIRVLAKEENFITILDRQGQRTHSVNCNVRRLAVGNKNRLVDTRMPQVRTFNCRCFLECQPSLSCFKFLRVLSLSSGNSSYMDITNHLEHLGKLVHLRYLALSYMNIHELPKEIGDLKFLHTLDFYCVRLQELPQSVGQLSLKCLWLEETNTRVPDWIGNLTSLEMLCLNSVSDSSNFVNELGKLTELRKLRISGTLCLLGLSRTKAWAESLVKLQKIQVIDIGRVESRRYDDATYNWECFIPPRQLHVLRLPYYQSGLITRITPSLLPNLSHLSAELDNPDLEIFGRFPELVTLELTMPLGSLHDAMGAPGAFPKLRVFATDGTPRRFLEGDMPILESLRFSLVIAWASEDGVVNDFEFASLMNLPSLQKVRVDLFAPGADIDKAKEAVMHAIDILPNPPMLQVATYEMDIGDSHSD